MFGCEPESYQAITKQCIDQFSSYFGSLIFNLNARFLPGLEWLLLWNKCFNFLYCVSNDDRKASLDLLMKDKNWPSTVKDDEKARIKAEYVTLLINAMFLMGKPDMITNERP